MATGFDPQEKYSKTDFQCVGTISLCRLLPGSLTVPVGSARVLADEVGAMPLQDLLAYAISTGPAGQAAGRPRQPCGRPPVLWAG